MPHWPRRVTRRHVMVGKVVNPGVESVRENGELGRRAKGDEQKVKIAMRLREETAVTVKWIAERLGMGAPGYVNHF